MGNKRDLSISVSREKIKLLSQLNKCSNTNSFKYYFEYKKIYRMVLNDAKDMNLEKKEEEINYMLNGYIEVRCVHNNPSQNILNLDDIKIYQLFAVAETFNNIFTDVIKPSDPLKSSNFCIISLYH